MPMDYEKGAHKGFAFIEFQDAGKLEQVPPQHAVFCLTKYDPQTTLPKPFTTWMALNCSQKPSP